MSGPTAHIEVDIDEKLHTLLHALSKSQNMSIETILEEAIRNYIQLYTSKNEKDSLFNIIGSFETEEGNWSERSDWRE